MTSPRLSPLADAAIAGASRQCAATGKRKDISDPGQPGLNLRVTPNGVRTWVLSCRDAFGRSRRFPLGAHPAIGLAEARGKARALRQAVKAGADPIAAAKRQRAAGQAAVNGSGTLTALLDSYGRIGKAAGMRRWPEYRRRIETVFGALLRRPLAALTLGDLQICADEYRTRSTAATAVQNLRPVLRWAAAPGRAYVEKALGELAGKVVHTPRQRTLSHEELAKVLPVLRDPMQLAAAVQPACHAMHLMLLTLARREEAGCICWREIDWRRAVWAVPGGRMKSAKPHVVPLSRQAVALLRSHLPSDGSTPDPDALVFPRADGKPLTKWQHPTEKVQAASATSGWTRHDLRRTGATLLGHMGEAPHVIEIALAHATLGRVAATYNLSRYQREHAEALQRLADMLDSIAAGGEKVVPMHRQG